MDCDSYALEHFGGPVRNVSPQGCYSYTVTAAGGGTIVQFRDNASRLPNMTFSELIYNTHPELVAIPTFIGIFGPESSSGLSVYCMNALPGIKFFNMFDTFSNSLEMQMAYAESLARYASVRHHIVAPFSDDRRFFAQAWLKPILEGEMLERTKVEAEITDRLGELHRTLPDQFLPLVDHVLKNLHKLTAPSYPFVFTHGDFSEFNLLLLDEMSGAISGVVDWSEACILPFGFTLHGVEYGLGAMYTDGWTYCENASHVREHFWATFKQIVQPTKDEVEAMKLARLAGILFRYGTRSGSHSGTVWSQRSRFE